METDDFVAPKGFNFSEFITKKEISSLTEEFPRNKNGEIDGRRKAFRDFHREANNSLVPINNAGTTDLRCSTKESVLREKLAKLIKKKDQK
jgi:hypothetical protein